jgi:hypothetical protein
VLRSLNSFLQNYMIMIARESSLASFEPQESALACAYPLRFVPGLVAPILIGCGEITHAKRLGLMFG